MNVESWLQLLAGELRRHGIAPTQAGAVLADARTHLRDSRRGRGRRQFPH